MIQTSQWLRLCTPSEGGSGSISGQGARTHMLQLKKKENPESHNEDRISHMMQLRPSAAKIN